MWEGWLLRRFGKSVTEMFAGESLLGASKKEGAFGAFVCDGVFCRTGTVSCRCSSPMVPVVFRVIDEFSCSDPSLSAKLPKVGNLPAPDPALPKCDKFPWLRLNAFDSDSLRNASYVGGRLREPEGGETVCGRVGVSFQFFLPCPAMVESVGMWSESATKPK